MITVTEIPSKKNENRRFATGVYRLQNVSRAMAKSFWDYLVQQGEISGYEIKED